MRFIPVLLILNGFCLPLAAQSTAYVFMGGLTVGMQKWDNNFDRQLLFAPHGAIAIETVNNENDRSSVFAQFGYHVKGSANRFRFFYQGGGIDQFTEKFQFRNLSLLLGAKQKFPLGPKAKYFYFGGIRGDYTLSTNIDELGANNPYAAIYYPFVGAMNRWMAGVSAGGGIEISLGDLIGAQLMLSVNPDFTNQYNQPGIDNVIDPLNPGTTTSIPARRIRNTTIELSVGLRLLKKVVYEEE